MTYASALSHYNMNLHLLRLEKGPDGLSRAAGEPVALTAGDSKWHVHNGGFTPDRKSVVYTRTRTPRTSTRSKERSPTRPAGDRVKSRKIIAVC